MRTDSPPRLSAVVPTWNGAVHLARCLESLLAQRDVDLEIVLSDDASSDATLEVARSFADPRLRIQAHEQRLGLSGNWNRALRAARGTYVSLVGQDDWVDDVWGATLVGLLEAHPSAALAFSRRRFHIADEASRAAVGDFFERRYPELLAPFRARLDATGPLVPTEVLVEEAMRSCFEINLIGEPSFVVVRRDHPAARAGFDPNMAQMIDWEFFVRFFLTGPVVHHFGELGTYHIHSRGQSVENSPLSRHYREYGYFLRQVTPRVVPFLSEADRARLAERAREVEALRVEWEERDRARARGIEPSG